QWYDFPQYIETLTGLISRGISEINADDMDIIYSAHSLPEDFINKGDPYLEQIKATIEAVNSLLVTRYSLPARWHLSFQSRSGPVRWLKPSTDETIIRLSKTGSKNLLVVPISFVSDHIETLYEIDILYKELARKHGVNLKRCQSLNTSGEFINTLKELVMTKVKTV
ncbi:MAG: ferrochelatase, partial [Candidatus Mariimomonas ferrooxydans]